MKKEIKKAKLMMKKNKKTSFDLVEEKIGFKFNDKNLLKVVFTHRSFINESPEQNLEHNERLEFLGDAVLELVVTEYLYRNFPNPEGELTNWRSSIVRGDVLASVAGKLNLGSFLLLSRGEERSGGRSRNLILANTFEALIGAIYLDRGYEAATRFINKHLISLLPEIIEKKLYLDPKSNLQEICQEKFGKTPEYKVIKESGPDHNKEFKVAVFVGGEQLASGLGGSKQRAEQAAATAALKKFNLND